MANTKLLCMFLVSFLPRLVISRDGNSPIVDQYPIDYEERTWCVVEPITPPRYKLEAFLDSACSQLDCKEIRPGGSCFDPNTLEDHASYVLNLIYRANGTCEPDIGGILITDPSSGSCHYP